MLLSVSRNIEHLRIQNAWWLTDVASEAIKGTTVLNIVAVKMKLSAFRGRASENPPLPAKNGKWAKSRNTSYCSV